MSGLTKSEVAFFVYAAEDAQDEFERAKHKLDRARAKAERAQAQLIPEPAAPAEGKPASITRYSCPACGLDAWAKPDALIICGECVAKLEPVAESS